MPQFQELSESLWILIQELISWSPPKERGPRTNLKLFGMHFYIFSLMDVV